MIYDNGLLVSSGMISEDLFENNDVCYCSLLFISMVTKTKTKPKCKAKYTHCLVHLLKSWVTFLHLLLFSISDPLTMATNNRQITKLFILQIWNLPNYQNDILHWYLCSLPQNWAIMAHDFLSLSHRSKILKIVDKRCLISSNSLISKKALTKLEVILTTTCWRGRFNWA